MKHSFKLFQLLLIFSLMVAGSCTKKDDPEPATPAYYFNGTFGDEVLHYGNNNWVNTGYGGGGLMHISATDEYVCDFGSNSYWYNPNKSASLNFMFNQIKFNVNADYIPSESVLRDIWKSGPVKSITTYSVPGSSTTLSQGWWIVYNDENGKQWTNEQHDDGYVFIVQKETTYIQGKELKVTGYITCNLHEVNNPAHVKTLRGKFSQIVSNYYVSPFVNEL